MRYRTIGGRTKSPVPLALMAVREEDQLEDYLPDTAGAAVQVRVGGRHRPVVRPVRSPERR
jgi:hypothetical protein